jgi:16S rRNA processing protein RimM
MNSEMENSYRNIGKIVSAFGLKGDLIVLHHLGKKISVTKLKVIFLEQKKGELLPYFISFVKKKGDDELMLKLEGIDSKEAVSKYLRRDVWIREEEVAWHTAKDNPIGWVGYHVLDQGQDLGIVLEIIEQPHQILCRLEIQDKEVLIPINEQTLRKIDHASKSLILELPDGLLEVYLG